MESCCPRVPASAVVLADLVQNVKMGAVGRIIAVTVFSMHQACLKIAVNRYADLVSFVLGIRFCLQQPCRCHRRNARIPVDHDRQPQADAKAPKPRAVPVTPTPSDLTKLPRRVQVQTNMAMTSNGPSPAEGDLASARQGPPLRCLRRLPAPPAPVYTGNNYVTC